MIVARFALSAALLFLSTSSAFASNPYGIPADIDAGLRDGFYALFNLNFSSAEARIQALQPAAEEHPMVALAAAVVPWWKLTVQVLERDDAASRAFLEASDRCLKIAEKKLPRDRHQEARVALGTMLGLMSRWSAANRAWLAAYSRGSKSVAHLERALKSNPAAADAYMTLGTFNYARSLLSKRIGGKTLSEDTDAQNAGLTQLRKAYERAPYFREAAGVLLAGILANEKPADALPVLASLRKELPGSAFVHMVLVSALYNAGDETSLEREANDLSARVNSGVYGPWFRPQARFAQALVMFRRGKWKAAGKMFEEASTSADESNPYTTWAILYDGYCQDALGKRGKAEANYRKVLSLKPRFASHEHARERLAQPFKKTDPELTKLEL